MLIRSLASIFVIASSFFLASGQAPAPAKQGGDKNVGVTTNTLQPLRDIPFPAGVNLQFLIKELARDINLNVLFDSESRLDNRTIKIELKNVTISNALKYIFQQEGLISEELAPNTILVSLQARASSIPQIGVGVTLLPQQLAQYFGVDGGLLVNNVRPDSPAARGGFKAGDVITEINGVVVRGTVTGIRAIDDKKEGDTIIKIVRDHKDHQVELHLNNN